MIICSQCGCQNQDYTTQCMNCTAPLVPMAQPAPVYAPQPAFQQQQEITSVGGWFGWYMLMCFLPLIGTIIMLCTTKDPSAKNFAKLMLILQIVVIVIYVLIIAVVIAGIKSSGF